MANVNTDMGVQQINSLIKPVVNKVVPVYLVKIDSAGVGINKYSYFLATKMDETAFYTKLVGFFIKEDVEKISQTYSEKINSSDKVIYIEILVPWSRVVHMQNLIYRHK